MSSNSNSTKLLCPTCKSDDIHMAFCGEEKHNVHVVVGENIEIAKGTILKKLIGKFYILEENNTNNWDSGYEPIVVKHTLNDCIDIFKYLHGSGQLGHDVRRNTYRIRSFMIDDFEDNWVTERDDLENILPQERANKNLNDETLIRKCNEYLAAKKCLAQGNFTGTSSIDCFMNKKDKRFKHRFCKIHECTHTLCKCNILIDEFYKLLSGQGHNVYYTRPVMVEGD